MQGKVSFLIIRFVLDQRHWSHRAISRNCHLTCYLFSFYETIYQKFGAHVVIEGAHILESKKHAEGLCAEAGLTYVNGYDDPPIIAGAGTIGMEVNSSFRVTAPLSIV